MELLEQVLGLISGPVAAIVLGVATMIVFKAPLSRLLDRTKKITTRGLETEATNQKIALTASAAEELHRVFDNALLVQREALVRTTLEGLEFRDPTERESFLIRFLAASAISQQFERAYWNIWGSQLAALQFLNGLGTDGAEQDWLLPFYEQSAAKDPQAEVEYPFDQWLGFLVSHQLASPEGTRIGVTLEGREFLKYILHQGYPLHRTG